MSNSYKNLQDRGFIKQCSNEESLQKKMESETITFYIGFDPTADSLHIGSLVPIMAMAHLQRDGHNPICLIGGGTALIGDPSGKTEMRKMLPPETILANGKKIHKQISQYLSTEGKQAVFVNNHDWLGELKYIDFLREIGKFFKVNEMIKSESYRIRLERQEGLSFIEFNYQLLQAYDFMILNNQYDCYLQMGGDDQWGNILAGTGLVRQMHQKEVFALTFPLLETANGKKMGKSESGAVWLDANKTSPFEFYQYWINTDDRDVIKFLRLFTFLSLTEIERFECLTGSDIRKAKEVLAFETTKIAHGEMEATKAMMAAKSLFGTDQNTQEEIPSINIDIKQLSDGITVYNLFYQAGLASSKAAAKKLIEQGGAYINNVRVSNTENIITEKDLENGSMLLRQGKKKYIRVLFK